MNFCCRFYCLLVEGRPASIAAMMTLPGKTKDVMACSRLVTLPDWQGLGLAMNLIDRLGACYKAVATRTPTRQDGCWMVEEIDCRFAWICDRAPRPKLEAVIYRATRAAWPVFQPYHYMGADLNKSAFCYLLAVEGKLAAFAATIMFPHAQRRDIRRVHRVVVLPDWQGIGLGMVLIGKLGAAQKAVGHELRLSTAAASFARTLRRSSDWSEVSRGVIHKRSRELCGVGAFGGKCISTYCYVGPVMDPTEARTLLDTSNKPSLPRRGTG